jgi:hypothetical protein
LTHEELLQGIAPPEHTATASTSTLCKVLTWDAEQLWQHAAAEGRTPIISHQADWLAALLHGQPGVTDWNNCLKLGYDPGAEEYPDWLVDQVSLPSVLRIAIQAALLFLLFLQHRVMHCPSGRACSSPCPGTGSPLVFSGEAKQAKLCLNVAGTLRA